LTEKMRETAKLSTHTTKYLYCEHMYVPVQTSRNEDGSDLFLFMEAILIKMIYMTTYFLNKCNNYSGSKLLSKSAVLKTSNKLIARNIKS
jgi:hypothetical protein